MTDIVERLRAENERLAHRRFPQSVLCEACDEAHWADVIRLEAICLRTGETFTVAATKDQNAPGQADANPSQCPTSKTE